MKHLLVLAALSSSAAAHPGASTLIEIRHRSEVSAPTDTIRVLANGRVLTVKRDADGRVTERDMDLLDKRELRAIRRAVREATWDVTESRIRCFAYSPSYTEYVVHGDVMLREQFCSGRAPDETTAASLATINHVLGLR